MKYIHTEQHGIVLFSDAVTHVDMARMLCPGRRESVLSAGFVNISDDVQCYGRSVSLDVAALPEDSRLLKVQIEL